MKTFLCFYSLDGRSFRSRICDVLYQNSVPTVANLSIFSHQHLFGRLGGNYTKLNSQKIFIKVYKYLQTFTVTIYRHLASDTNNGVHQLVTNILRNVGVMAPTEVSIYFVFY